MGGSRRRSARWAPAAARPEGDPDRGGRPAGRRARRRRDRRLEPRRPPARSRRGHGRRPRGDRRRGPGRTEVWVDGGVRRGLDVAIALALGARGVLLGRPVLWALAAGGQAGVERALAILREELEIALALLGAPTPADVDPGPRRGLRRAAPQRARGSAAPGARRSARRRCRGTSRRADRRRSRRSGCPSNSSSSRRVVDRGQHRP